MISHPLLDLGPELLNLSLGQMETMLAEIAVRTDLQPKQVKRLAQFSELVGRYRQIKDALGSFCLSKGFYLDAGEQQPELYIKEVLCATPYAETTEDLLGALCVAVQDLLRLSPQNPVQAQTKAQGLAILLPFYQVTHAIYFYFAETPEYA